MASVNDTSPIERAARALFEYEPGPYADCVEWAIEQDFGWRDQIDAVKLVLRAIREPSETMFGDRVTRQHGYSGDIDLVWQAMIDALLSEADRTA